MPKNADSLNSELFDFLQSRGFKPTLLDTSGKEIPVPEKAEVFQFDFEIDGENYGTATISIDGLHKLVVYFGEGIANSPKTSKDDSESWYSLLRQFKYFSQKHQLSFETKNIDRLKHDMAKREHTKQLDEGYYPMGNKASYSDNIPTTKMIIKHKRKMEEGEQRFRQIDRIFIENAIGERVLAPSNKPGLARTFARHIAEGGRPYDERWNHLMELCEEYDKMAGFVRATRNNQFILNRLKKNLSSPPMLPQVQELEEWADSVIDMDKDAMPMDMKPAELGEEEKIAGRHDPADFDDMVKRVGVKAKKKPVDMTDLARRLHAAMAKDKKKEEKTDEGLAGATMGGIAGAVLTKSPSGAMTGASMGSDIEDVIKNESLELIADPLLRFKKLSGL